MLNDPLFTSSQRGFDTIDIEDESEIFRAGYVGRFLLEPDVRRELIQRISEIEVDIQRASSIDGISRGISSAANAGTAGMLAGDMLTGTFGSGTGNMLGNAFAIGAVGLALLSGDGSFDDVSGVYLPGFYNNAEITTAEQAQNIASKLVTQKVYVAMQELGFKGVCELGCDSFTAVHAFTLNDASKSSFIDYVPPKVLVYLNVNEFVSNEKALAYHSRAVSFPVKWYSKMVDGARVLLVSDNTKGNVIAKSFIDDEGNVNVSGTFLINNTMFAEYVNRKIYDNPFMYKGTSDDYPKWLAYNGKIYRFSLNSIAKTFSEEILPSTYSSEE
jgi:hypothetical protein